MLETPDSRKCILIVDDQPFIAKIIEFNLDRARYWVEYCRDAEAALIRLKNAPPDLIISDIFMPKVTGPELCQFVRNTLHLTRLPIIMLTSHGDAGAAEESLNAGATAFMTKPFSPRELSAKIDELLVPSAADGHG